MRKALWTLNIGNYAPKITALTYPFMKIFAQKMRAEFNVITERKFPNNDTEYEKLQIHELGKDYDWNFYLDGDAIVHPEMFDFTNYLPKDTVMHHGVDAMDFRWSSDEYFLRDGRNLSSCNWFAVASDWCLDLWRPPDDLTEDEAVARIRVCNGERLHDIEPRHLVSDYLLSRNIARFGLKCTTLNDMLKKLGREKSGYFFHQYTTPHEKKAAQLRDVLKAWNLLDIIEPSLHEQTVAAQLALEEKGQ